MKKRHAYLLGFSCVFLFACSKPKLPAVKIVQGPGSYRCTYKDRLTQRHYFGESTVRAYALSYASMHCLAGNHPDACVFLSCEFIPKK